MTTTTTGLPFAPEDVSTLALEVGTAVLGRDLVPTGAVTDGVPVGPTACVQITGDWEGSVLLTVDDALALDVAATMFDLPADAIGAEETADALGELANIVGGSVKGLIDGSAQLSLPTVTLGAQARTVVPQADLVHQAAFDAGTGHLVVALWQRAQPAGSHDLV